MLLERRIKRYMDDIIDVAFPDKEETDIARYKNYHLKILPKENSSSSGHYIYDGNKIEIYNPSLGECHLAKCCLHELSHHIDRMQNGKSGHQQPFYDVYAKLIYASLDMKILTVKDFDDNWSSDANKVKKIVKEYVPKPVDYCLQKDVLIRVYNGFIFKDVLKLRGYKWNGIEQVWERMHGFNSPEEEAFLSEMGVFKLPDNATPPKGAYYKIEEAEMHIKAIIYLIAEGDTYKFKDTLKEYGFYYKPEDKTWVLKLKANDKNWMLKQLKEDARLKGCSIKVMKR